MHRAMFSRPFGLCRPVGLTVATYQIYFTRIGGKSLPVCSGRSTIVNADRATSHGVFYDRMALLNFARTTTDDTAEGI